MSYQNFQPKSHWKLKLFLFVIIISTFIFLIGRYTQICSFCSRTSSFLVNSKNTIKNVFAKDTINPTTLPNNPNGNILQINIVEPPKEVAEWCRIQNIPVKESITEPISVNTVGYDVINECCTVEYKGISSCTQLSSSIRYCFSGNLNSNIKWVSVDGYFIKNTQQIKRHIDKLNKQVIQDLVGCECLEYPESLKIYKPEVETNCFEWLK